MDFVIGTWNVRTLYKSEVATNLVKGVEKYEMKFVALQEVRWDDSETTKISITTFLSGKCEQNHNKMVHVPTKVKDKEENSIAYSTQ